MRVASLFRYPLKGFSREACGHLDILPGGRVAGDRVLGLRWHGVETPDDAWGPKTEFTALVNTPGLAVLHVAFDPATQHLRLSRGGEALFDGVLDDVGRRRLAAAVQAHVLALADSPLAGHPERLPLRVVGDGLTPRLQDREPGYVTLHGRGSVDAVAAAIDEAPGQAEQRFRSNIALEGLAPWQEQDWVGRRLRIGDVVFDVHKPVTRCLATHANPATGERDRPVMPTLLKLLPTQRPTFAVMMTSEVGGRIRVGDPVGLLD